MDTLCQHWVWEVVGLDFFDEFCAEVVDEFTREWTEVLLTLCDVSDARVGFVAGLVDDRLFRDGEVRVAGLNVCVGDSAFDVEVLAVGEGYGDVAGPDGIGQSGEFVETVLTP